MERLISRLQETLAEDEAAKEALLHLRNNPNEVHFSPRKYSGVSQLDVPKECPSESGNVFIMELIVASTLSTCSGFLDLPLKMVANKVDLNMGLLQNICTTQTKDWSSNLQKSMEQVAEAYDLAIQRGVCTASSSQRNKLSEFKKELTALHAAPHSAGKRPRSQVFQHG
jgi:hypothetical protein